MNQPPGFTVKGSEKKVCRLRKSIYGLKQSALVWNQTAVEALLKIGFIQSKVDACLFTREEKGELTYVLLYVDDLLVVGKTAKTTQTVHQQLSQYFEVRDLGDVGFYLGVKVERADNGDLLLSQAAKVYQLIRDTGLTDAKPTKTPMETGFLAANPDESPKLPNNTQYRQAIGSLLYLATVSRPDIAVSVGFLARRVESPTKADWESVKRVIRYLASTASCKLRFSAESDNVLRCFVDADFAGDRSDRKSTSAYVFSIGSSTLAWSSKKQSTLAMSSTEAEYVATSHAAKELQWLRMLLTEMKVLPPGATPVYEDNQACIRMIQAAQSSTRTKHIDLCYHQLRGLQREKVIDVQYLPSDQMVADVLTKPLPRVAFEKMCDKLGLVDREARN